MQRIEKQRKLHARNKDRKPKKVRVESMLFHFTPRKGVKAGTSALLSVLETINFRHKLIY